MLISEIRCGCGGSVRAIYCRELVSGKKRDWFIKCENCNLRTSYWTTKRQAKKSFILATRIKNGGC